MYIVFCMSLRNTYKNKMFKKKYLGVNLNKYVPNFQPENYKTLLRETKQGPNKWTDMPYYILKDNTKDINST